MPTVAAIKAAARKLPVADRTDLLVDLAMDAAVRKEQLARIRAAIDEGDLDLAEGRYTEIDSETEIRALFDDAKRRGRARVKQSA